MGKKDKKPATAVADTAADIDDIFAAPKKSKPAVAEQPSSSSKPSKSSSKDKSKSSEKSEKAEEKEKSDKKDKSEKKEKKRKSESEEPAKKKNKSERVVEEVVDPSLAVKAAVEKAKQKPVKAAKARGKEVEEDMAFRDSRGDAGRKRTEEGYLVFKEAELGIDPEAGGTPLCPFDCECCF
ncbi:hypothetical protein A1Q1_06633 [Trichosporon asahii var. asahii CBS 2479]|uniref:DUF1764-domain-containing protein n=1 Tax=Trichosporon asahii var. asahii (strain ATCC 90039 / CBS 2479 / JCM 2466 / KCTC 7840 / NBRC 103889/ NCYC 2677 / UAMH 7654) TaxID=1186058 RepID=J4UJU9_TRIAS|nr:hypothetical protein A1Q1_06633 [Trichosporon asahii var. asahii CBS 2479]EJT52095.1 hypothetical protein A1Q1_06633 [Trichosporon asahii var. asahii CBS 2479]